MAHRAVRDRAIELKLELIQSHMAQNLDRAILSSSRGRLWFFNGPFALAESVAGRRSRLLRVCYTTSAGFQKLYKPGTIYLHRGALRGTPGSACPQPEPNATELPKVSPPKRQMPLSCPVAPPSQRELHKDGGGGGGGVARRARAARAPKAKSCTTCSETSSKTPCAASLTCWRRRRRRRRWWCEREVQCAVVVAHRWPHMHSPGDRRGGPP